jgi:hypothetical protein
MPEDGKQPFVTWATLKLALAGALIGVVAGLILGGGVGMAVVGVLGLTAGLLVARNRSQGLSQHGRTRGAGRR